MSVFILGESGITSDREKMMEQILKWWYTADYSQSVVYYGEIESLRYIVSKGLEDTNLETAIENSLEKLFSVYFSVVELSVIVVSDDAKMSIKVELTCGDEYSTSTLTEVINFSKLNLLLEDDFINQYLGAVK